MRISLALTLAVAGLGLGQEIALQPLRVRGQIVAEGGGPIANARLRTDAIRGRGGAQFVGQREFMVRTDRSGDWSLLGLVPGLWILEMTASDHLPHVVVLPIYMMRAPEPAPWDSSFSLLPIARVSGAGNEDVGRRVIQAVADAGAGRRVAVLDGLSAILASTKESTIDAAALCAAGDIALLVRDPKLARTLFDLAAVQSPKWYRPHLGIASSSMMLFDFDRAMKAFGEARTTGANSRVERMLSGVIREIQQIRTIGG
jgi:hypothetical protein